MAIANQDMMNSAEDQYKESFNEDVVAPVAQTDDEAFGITPPADAVAAAEVGSTVAAATEAADTPEIAAEPVTAVAEIDQNAVATESPDMPAMDHKEMQRLKSWEGRLKKMEADLNARSAAPQEAAAEVIEATGEQAEADGNAELGVAAEQVAAQVEDGSMTTAQAMRQLAEDFGEEFVKMIEVIASAKAADVGAKAVDGLKGDVTSIIDHISSSSQKAHFKEIARAHPDFNDVGGSEEFQAFLQGDAGRQKVAENGDSDEIIQLINDYKASQTPEPAPTAAEAPEAATGDASADIQADDASDPEGADAALGVRSGGLRLPAQPADNSDFEGAWNEAAKVK